MCMKTTTNTQNIFNDIDEARAFALAESKKNPTSYYLITSCFGWFVESASRLRVQSPSDATHFSGQTGTYWKNGKEKPFTEKQKIADELATPWGS